MYLFKCIDNLMNDGKLEMWCCDVFIVGILINFDFIGVGYYFVMVKDWDCDVKVVMNVIK